MSPAGAPAAGRRGVVATSLRSTAARVLAVLDERQPAATPEVMSAVTGGLLLACAVMASVAWGLRIHEPNRAPLACLLLECFVSGALLLVLRRRLQTPHYHLVFLGGVVVIAVSARLDGAGSAAAAMANISLLTLMSVVSLFFFPWRTGVVHLAITEVAAVAALHGLVSTADLLLLLTTWALAASVVRILTRATLTAEVDDLTGLTNRRGAERAAPVLMAQRRRTGSAVTVVLLDLDHFKVINDTLGHAAGDELLRAVGRSWKRLLPDGALLGRWGGDEFVLVVPGDVSTTAELVDSMRGSMPVGRTATAGVALVAAQDALAGALHRADEALYVAKRAQRGTTGVWSPVGEHAVLAAGQPWLESQPSMRSDSGSSGSSAPPASSGASSRSMPTAAI